MGTVTHSIGIGGTHDYTSLSAWAAALPANLVTDGNAQVAQLYFNGSGDGEFVTASGNILTLTGHTTNTVNTITITTGPGQSFRDHVNIRTNALTYNASNGVAIRTTATAYQITIIINDNNVFLSNLQINNVNYRSSVFSYTGTGTLTVDNCILRGANEALNSVGASSSTWNNCLFEYIGLFYGRVVVTRGTVRFNFCTFALPSDYTGISDVIGISYETSYFTNCAIFGAANAISVYATTPVSANCATDDTTPLAGFTGSLTFTSQFIGTTSSAPDWRVKPGSFLIGNGDIGANTTGIKLVSSYSPGSNRADFSGGVGVSFVPTINISINKLGVRCATGNSGAHTVELRDWNNPGSPTLLRSAVVDLTGGTVGTFYYAVTGLITLIAGHAYYIGTVETNGGQNWSNEGPATLLNVTSVNASYIFGGGGSNSSANYMYVGVDFDLDLGPLVADISGGPRVVGLNYDIGAWEYTAGLTAHSIGIGGTHDYTSLSAWAAALPANLISDGNAQVAQLYFNGSGDGEFLTTTTFSHLLQLNGHTTDILHTIKITTGPGQSFRDNAGVRTNPLRYDASKGVALRCTASYTNVVNLTDNNVIFENLQIKQDGSNFSPIQSGSGFGNFVAQFNNCLIHNHCGIAATAVSLFASFDNAIFRNCVIIQDTQTGTGGVGVLVGRGGEYYFCTFVVPSGSAVTGSTSPLAAAYTGRPCIVKNCAIFGFAATYSSQVPTFTNCATDLASPPSGVTGSLTYTDQFEDITLSGGFDFRTKTGSALINAGVADTVNGAFDISGTARPVGAGYDIGAWEYGAAGPAAQSLTAVLFADRLVKPNLARIV